MCIYIYILRLIAIQDDRSCASIVQTDSTRVARSCCGAVCNVGLFALHRYLFPVQCSTREDLVKEEQRIKQLKQRFAQDNTYASNMHHCNYSLFCVLTNFVVASRVSTWQYSGQWGMSSYQSSQLPIYFKMKDIVNSIIDDAITQSRMCAGFFSLNVLDYVVRCICLRSLLTYLWW